MGPPIQQHTCSGLHRHSPHSLFQHTLCDVSAIARAPLLHTRGRIRSIPSPYQSAASLLVFSAAQRRKASHSKHLATWWRCCDASSSEAASSSAFPATDNVHSSQLEATRNEDAGIVHSSPFDTAENEVARSGVESGSLLEPDWLGDAQSYAAMQGEIPLGVLSIGAQGGCLENEDDANGPFQLNVAIEDEGSGSMDEEESLASTLLQQMRDIILFAGPGLGIWLSGPIMSLIDTAVVGNSSSLELAALGPGTVFCDQVGYLFMFLSVSTANLIATALAKQDKSEAEHHLARLLFVALVCGIGMLLLTAIFSQSLLMAFVGPQNASLVPAACTYVQIRGFAWPAVLVGLVLLSASLGMQDSWVPMKALILASFVNAFGDIIFCTYLKYGIAGAAWATALSQYVAGYLMLRSLYAKGYNALNLRIPSFEELIFMVKLAAPVLLTMLSKVCFYALATYLSTSLGPVALAAHQVMLGLYAMCSVSGEPLAQTAQAFMPALILGHKPNLKKAQVLLRSLLLIGVVFGVVLGLFAMCFPWFFPQVFTNDKAIVNQMRTVTWAFLWGLAVTPPLLSLEGTLLAGRDLKFLSLSMLSCFICGATLLMVCKNMGFGLQGFWWTMAFFQSVRFLAASVRLRSTGSILREPSGSEDQQSRVKLA